MFDDDTKEIIKKDELKTNTRMSKLFEATDDDEDDRKLMTRTKNMTQIYKREETAPVIATKMQGEDKSLFPTHLATSPKQQTQEKKEDKRMSSLFKEDSDDDDFLSSKRNKKVNKIKFFFF